MSDHTPTPDAAISDATGDTAIDVPVDAAPPATTIVATPEWVCTAPSPLAATLALDEYATRTDARLPDLPRRTRHSVDLLIAAPPIRLNARRARPYDSHDLIWDLEHDLVATLSSWLPVLRPGAAVAFITRLTPYRGELVDP